MNKHAFRLRDYLEHMAESVRRIAEYTEGQSEQDFLSDPRTQDAVMRNFGVLGEAANNCLKVAPDVALQYPELPFARIYGLRNQLTHGYTTVDLEILWNVIENDVPKLRKQLANVLELMGGPSNPA